MAAQTFELQQSNFKPSVIGAIVEAVSEAFSLLSIVGQIDHPRSRDLDIAADAEAWARRATGASGFGGV